MPAGQSINVGSIYADLDVNSGNMERGLAKGEEAIRKIEARVNALTVLLNRGAISHAEFNRQVAQLDFLSTNIANRMQTANTALGGTKSAVDLMNASLANSSGASSRAAMAMMQFGYMVDDAQYGVNALVNNIAPLVYGMSGSAGVAAAAQIAAVAINMLVQHWDELREAFGDTSAMDEAMRSIKGMSEHLEKLQYDAENFSWGQTLTKGLAGLGGQQYNPDEGKAGQAAIEKEMLDLEKKAEAAANKMEGHQTKKEKEQADRFNEALSDAGGFKKVQAALADYNLQTQGIAANLSDAKGSFRGMVEQVDPMSAKMLGLATMREEYQRMQDKEASGSGLTEVEKGRKIDLENIAKRRALELAHSQLGKGAFDKEVQAHVAKIVGGKEGDIISGKIDTTEDAAKKKTDADKETKRLEEDSKRLRKKHVAEIVKKTAPDLKGLSDEVAELVATGAYDEKKGISIIEGHLYTKELSPAEQSEAAKEAFEETRKDNPEERKKRILQKAEKRAKEAIPDLKAKADRLADKVHQGTMTSEEAGKSLVGDLIKGGLNEDDAWRAAKVESDRTAKENPLLRSRRLKSERERKAEEIVPDLQDQVERAVAIGMATGKSDDATRSALNLKFREGGMDKEEAGFAVRDLFREGTENVRQRLAGVRGGRPEDQQPSRSEIYRTSDLTSKIQGSISDQETEYKKHTTLLEKQYQTLQKIASKSSVQIEVS